MDTDRQHGHSPARRDTGGSVPRTATTEQSESGASKLHGNPGYTLTTGMPKKQTHEDWEGHLLRIPVEAALAEKDKRGLIEHRNGDRQQPFNGSLPVMMHSEGLDLALYARYARNHGGYDNAILLKIHEAGMAAIEGARLLAKKG